MSWATVSFAIKLVAMANFAGLSLICQIRSWRLARAGMPILSTLLSIESALHLILVWIVASHSL